MENTIPEDVAAAQSINVEPTTPPISPFPATAEQPIPGAPAAVPQTEAARQATADAVGIDQNPTGTAADTAAPATPEDVIRIEAEKLSVAQIRAREVSVLLRSKDKNIEASGKPQWIGAEKQNLYISGLLPQEKDGPLTYTDPEDANNKFDYVPLDIGGQPPAVVEVSPGVYRPAHPGEADAILLSKMTDKATNQDGVSEIYCRDKSGHQIIVTLKTLQDAQSIRTIAEGQIHGAFTPEEHTVFQAYREYLRTGEESHISGIDRNMLAEAALESAAGVKATSAKSMIERNLAEEVPAEGKSLTPQQIAANAEKRKLKQQLTEEFQLDDIAFLNSSELGSLLVKLNNKDEFSREKVAAQEQIDIIRSKINLGNMSDSDRIVAESHIEMLESKVTELTKLQQAQIDVMTKDVMDNMTGLEARDFDVMVKDGNIEGICKTLLKKYENDPEATKKINKLMKLSENLVAGSSLFMMLMILMMQQLQQGQGGH